MAILKKLKLAGLFSSLVFASSAACEMQGDFALDVTLKDAQGEIFTKEYPLTDLSLNSGKAFYAGVTERDDVQVEIQWGTSSPYTEKSEVIAVYKVTVYRLGQEETVEGEFGSSFSLPQMDGVSIRRIYKATSNANHNMPLPDQFGFKDLSVDFKLKHY